MSMIKDELNILIRKFVRLCFRVFFFLPLKKNQILFESYYGKSYSCNPKYISEYLATHYPDRYKLIWIFNNPQSYESINNIFPVKRNSLKHFFYRFTSKVIICNMTDEVYLPKRAEQIIINTWHAGGAYKRVGLSYNSSHSKASIWQDKILNFETSYYISSSKLFTQYNIHEAYGYTGKVLEIGMPRNDIFFDFPKMEVQTEILRKDFNVLDKVIILYAPTFRGDFAHAEALTNRLPYEEIINAVEMKYKKKAVLFNRSHYADLNKYDVNMLNVIDVTNYPDMQSLLLIADILITDYSSCIWDFALLGKPCFLYIPDYTQYIGERGTYTPIQSWPGEIAYSVPELVNLICNSSIEKSRKIAYEHLNRFGSYETGNACAALCKKIEEATR